MYTAELPCGDWGMIVDNIFRGFQKSGIKCRVVLLFIPLRRFYTVLCSFAVRERQQPKTSQEKRTKICLFIVSVVNTSGEPLLSNIFTNVCIKIWNSFNQWWKTDWGWKKLEAENLGSDLLWYRLMKLNTCTDRN